MTPPSVERLLICGRCGQCGVVNELDGKWKVEFQDKDGVVCCMTRNYATKEAAIKAWAKLTSEPL